MKKIYSLIAAAFCFGSLIAQPTLTQSNHAHMLSDTWQTIDCATVGITPGSTGTGQTWNYSTLTLLTNTLSWNVVTPASTGSAAAYPSSQVSVQQSTNNSFYSSSASDLRYWGGNGSMGGQQVTLTFTSSAIAAVYPMNMSSTGNSITGGSLTTSFGPGTFSGTSTVTAVGTGTLMLPSGKTYNNVLKVALMQTMTFTLGFGNGSLTQNRYEWYSTVAKQPLLAITNSTLTSAFGTSTDIQVALNQKYLILGVDELNNGILEGVTVYPNPAKDNINLNFTNENAEPVSFSIVNVIGQSVRQQAIPATKGETIYNVNLSGIESGIYFVKLTVGNKTSINKITVQ